jgi:hypothetical protein
MQFEKELEILAPREKGLELTLGRCEAKRSGHAGERGTAG